MSCLIFFAFFVLLACERKDTGEITVNWNDNQAISVSVPKKLLHDGTLDSIGQSFQVRLESINPVAILGEHNLAGNFLLFKPVIPFSRGLTYKIFFRERLIGIFKIPLANPKHASSLIAIYPTGDTLPLFGSMAQYQWPILKTC